MGVIDYACLNARRLISKMTPLSLLLAVASLYPPWCDCWLICSHGVLRGIIATHTQPRLGTCPRATSGSYVEAFVNMV